MKKLPTENEFNNFVRFAMERNAKISFWETLNLDKLSKYVDQKINLVFHKDWEYIPSKNDPMIRDGLGLVEQKLDLFKMYQNGEREKIEFMTTLRGSAKSPRLFNDEVTFSFIPYIHGSKTWLLVAAFRVKNAKEAVATKEDLLEYTPYIGRLVIEYSSKGANITLKDSTKIKKLSVSTILSLPADEMFLSYDKVRLSYDQLEGVLKTPEWSERLKAKKGVYLITDKKTGQLYVGSAYGKNGIYGRWKTYVDSSGGIIEESDGVRYPNKYFQKIIREKGGKEYIIKNFQYSILETFELGAPDSDILMRESYWKDVLKTREFGYNEN